MTAADGQWVPTARDLTVGRSGEPTRGIENGELRGDALEHEIGCTNGVFSPPVLWTNRDFGDLDTTMAVDGGL